MSKSQREPVPKWLRDIVEIANKTRLSSDGKVGVPELRRYFDPRELVIGVWREPSSPTGLGLMVIKGELILENIKETDIGEELTRGALLLRSPEEGVAMQEVLGLPQSK